MIVSTVVEANGDRVTIIERADRYRFEVRVPAGAMDGWEMYRPESGEGWITEQPTNGGT